MDVDDSEERGYDSASSTSVLQVPSSPTSTMTASKFPHLDLLEDVADVAAVVDILLAVAFSLLFLLGVVLNTVLIVVYMKRRGFRSQISNKLLLNLLLSNLFSCLLFTPFLLLDTVLSPATFPLQIFCPLFAATASVAGASSIFSQLLIGFDQFLAVVYPLRYHNWISKPRSRLLCVGSWAIAFSIGIGFFFLSDGSMGHCNHWTPCSVGSISGAAIGSAHFLLIFLLPFCMLVFLYASIFSAAHQNSSRTRRNSICSASFDGTHSPNHQHTPGLKHALPDLSRAQRPSRYGQYLDVLATSSRAAAAADANKSNLSGLTRNLRSSIRHRLSNVNPLCQYKEEGHAAKIALLVVLVVLLCWAPFYSLSLLHCLGLDRDRVFWLPPLALLLCSASPVLTTLIYGYRSRRVRREIRRVFGPRPARSQFHDLRPASARAQRVKSLSCPHLLISSCDKSNRDDDTFAKRLIIGREPPGRKTGALAIRMAIGQSGLRGPTCEMSPIAMIPCNSRTVTSLSSSASSGSTSISRVTSASASASATTSAA